MRHRETVTSFRIKEQVTGVLLEDFEHPLFRLSLVDLLERATGKPVLTNKVGRRSPRPPQNA